MDVIVEFWYVLYFNISRVGRRLVWDDVIGIGIKFSVGKKIIGISEEVRIFREGEWELEVR